MQHHQREHTTRTPIACLCSGSNYSASALACALPRLCSGMQSILPPLWHAIPYLSLGRQHHQVRAHHLHTGSLPLPRHETSPPLLQHVVYPALAPCSTTTCTPVARLALACNLPASALACNPPCLCSGIKLPQSGLDPPPLGTPMPLKGHGNISALFCLSSMASPFQQPPGISDPAYRQGQNCARPQDHFLTPTPHPWASASSALWDLMMQQSTTFAELQHS
jgi:hypothetical protein